MRALAADGRTVFVSSHLLAEMSNTADRLVVIGRGRLIAVDHRRRVRRDIGAETVRVRSPQLDAWRSVLTDAGIECDAEATARRCVVRGAAIEVVGDLAARNAHHAARTQRAACLAGGGLLKLTDDQPWSTGR